MKGIDTNILVRFLVGDDKVQAKKVYNIFKQAESAKDELFISLFVVMELIWVLESAYGISREEILESIDELLLMPTLHFEHQPVVHQFIQTAQGSNYDLLDLLIAHSANEKGCDAVITFDKKASKYKLFELVK
jgi:predicted nucleic-acid-binding protein